MLSLLCFYKTGIMLSISLPHITFLYSIKDSMWYFLKIKSSLLTNSLLLDIQVVSNFFLSHGQVNSSWRLVILLLLCTGPGQPVVHWVFVGLFLSIHCSALPLITQVLT